MSALDPTQPAGDPLGPLKHRLGAAVLVATTALLILAGFGACAVAVLGGLGVVHGHPAGPFLVAGAAGAAARLLRSFYYRDL